MIKTPLTAEPSLIDFLGEFLYNTKKLKRENDFKKM